MEFSNLFKFKSLFNKKTVTEVNTMLINTPNKRPSQELNVSIKTCPTANATKNGDQVTRVADSRDGACSSSTLKEASSWGKVDTSKEQMVFAEATSVLPLIASDAYHRQSWKNRERRNFQKLF